jgi:hypothetical protein
MLPSHPYLAATEIMREIIGCRLGLWPDQALYCRVRARDTLTSCSREMLDSYCL